MIIKAMVLGAAKFAALTVAYFICFILPTAIIPVAGELAQAIRESGSEGAMMFAILGFSLAVVVVVSSPVRHAAVGGIRLAGALVITLFGFLTVITRIETFYVERTIVNASFTECDRLPGSGIPRRAAWPVRAANSRAAGSLTGRRRLSRQTVATSRRNTMNWCWLCLPVILLAFSCSVRDDSEVGTIRGLYGSPVPFWEQGLTLRELGVNAVFLQSGAFSTTIVDRARSEGSRMFAEFATLNGRDYVDRHPDAWPVNDKGERVAPASWFLGVCPTHEGFRQSRLQALRELVRQYDVHGVWMDYVHWHAQFEDEDPILPETCFCDRCLQAFQDDTGVHIPAGSVAEKSSWLFANKDPEWRDWRCSVIAGWARDMKKVLQEERPGALLGMFHCPWTDEEFNGARRRILGIDYDTLRGTVDVFSPMVYHKLMGRPPGWVRENLAWFYRRLAVTTRKHPRVWPIVQAYNHPAPVSAEEFEAVLSYGLLPEATGVMMFTSVSVAEDSLKTAAMKKVYRSLAPPEDTGPPGPGRSQSSG